MPSTEDGPYRFVPPRAFSASTAATAGDARDDSVSDSREIVAELYDKWKQASAQQHKRGLVDSEGGNPHLADHVDGVLEFREIRRALDEATHVPIAGASAAPMFSETAQVDLLFFGQYSCDSCHRYVFEGPVAASDTA